MVNLGNPLEALDVSISLGFKVRGNRMGGSRRRPSTHYGASGLRARQHRETSVVLNLLGVQLDARPRYFSSLRVRSARPHWLVVDEASHVLPRDSQVVKLDSPRGAHQRHIRKYGQGTLGEDQSFSFRGERGALAAMNRLEKTDDFVILPSCVSRGDR